MVPISLGCWGRGCPGRIFGRASRSDSVSGCCLPWEPEPLEMELGLRSAALFWTSLCAVPWERPKVGDVSDLWGERPGRHPDSLLELWWLQRKSVWLEAQLPKEA